MADRLVPEAVQKDLDHLRHRVSELAKMPVPDEAMADVIGQLDYILSSLRRVVTNLKAEAAPTLDGDEYVWNNRGKNDYSFNLPSIVSKAVEATGNDVGQVLWDMVQNGVLKVAGVRALETYQAQNPGMVLLTVNSKVGDGDYGDVGKVWRDQWALVGKETDL